MALLDHVSSWEGKLTFFFRDREVLVTGGGDAAHDGRIASCLVPDAVLCCEDTAIGAVGVALGPEAQAPPDCRFEPFPAYFLIHDDTENARLARMKGLCNWLSANRFCPLCGQPLRLHPSESALVCPACGTLHYPRIEPCIITLVSRGDEILLLRNVKDRKGIYACLAGFVEMGETLEQAVRREIREETGLEVENIRYAGSQGWPFPDQLMVAFRADWKSGEIRIQESEIADARWFRRDALPLLPNPGSIAWRLITGRMGGQPAVPCKAPEYLSPGDGIALITPSYSLPAEKVEAAAAVLRDWGYRPRTGAYAGASGPGPYAGTDEERLADLLQALKDPSVKAILCNRGGYGAIHLSRLVSPGEFAAYPKWLIGFSDITTLHGMLTRAGVMSIHGTMGKFLAASGGKDRSSALLRDLLAGTVPQYVLPAHPHNRTGKGEGILTGGNLCSFTALLGSSLDALSQGDFILFIEEVEETMHHIDRMLNMLFLHGAMERCRGIVLGTFTDCPSDLAYGSVEEQVLASLGNRDIPVCCGFPAGHGPENYPLIMGAPVTLEVREEKATLTFGMEGQRRIVPVSL